MTSITIGGGIHGGGFVERSVAFQPWIWTAGNQEINFEPKIGETEPFKSYIVGPCLHNHRRWRKSRRPRYQHARATAEILGVPGGELQTCDIRHKEQDTRALQLAPEPQWGRGEADSMWFFNRVYTILDIL
ncbi:purple acid phosphatase 25-like isoform X2 [Andrographis paniculata]|uniref:purple acid phosphatase 25-like isoform X2 n=1 Tax=Andrographis paniculata TaxID=175694 RepID=UPI0021E70658|nr:purple acid phosphatase 25-like isoform X2 [Andrographis paniculata]